MVEQYTTLHYLPQVAKRIDDLHHENFHVPVLMHQARVLRSVSNSIQHAVGYVYDECDFVDARAPCTYAQPDFALRSIDVVSDLKRIAAANRAFAAALQGKAITARQLKCVLNASQLQEFNNSLREVVDASEIEYGDGVPWQLRTYNIKLNQADLTWWRYENMQVKPRNGRHRRHAATHEMENRAERLYEEALQNLEETFNCADRGDWGQETRVYLRRWMDREIDFDKGVDRKLNIDAQSMPRVRGSKSIYARDSGLPKLSKRLKRQYCTLRALLVAACDLAFILPQQPDVELSAADAQKIQRLLQQLKRQKIKGA